MAIPRNLGNLAQGADASGVLGTSKGGTGSTSTTFANLTTNVTGTLPIANGGTGSTSTTFANLTTNVTGTLPVANGGTGLTAAGTAGNVLVSDGTNFVSSAPAGGGSMIFLASATPSGGTITFEDLFTGYDTFVIIGTNVGTTSNVEVVFRLDSTYFTSGYNYAITNSGITSGTYVGRIGENSSGIRMYPTEFSPAPINFAMYISQPTSTTNSKYVYWTGAFGSRMSSGFGYNGNTALALNGIRFGGGTINAGTCRLYGIKNS